MLLRAGHFLNNVPKRQKNLYLKSEDAEFIESFPDKKANEVVTDAINLLRQGVTPREETKRSQFTVKEVIL